MKRSSTTPARWIYAIYCLSGFVSLGYQVSWYRIYVDQFGCSSLTFILVLSNFIVGLGAGALVSRRVVDWLQRLTGLKDKLRAYGLIELLVTMSVLLTLLTRFVPADAWGVFPYRIQSDGIYQATFAYQISKMSIATLTVFLPCFFMGVTYPLLCAVFQRDARFPAALYAWNTLGACSGVLACQILLLPTIGHTSTFLVMAAINGVLGLVMLLKGAASATDAEPSPKESSKPDRPGLFSVLTTIAILSGLLTGALEGDMFKRIGFIAAKSSTLMSFISFWVILAIFVGSALVRNLAWLRLTHIKIACVLGAAGYWITWKKAHAIIGWMLDRTYDAETIRAATIRFGLQDNPGALPISFPASLTQLLAYTGIFVFPVFLALSMLLPYVCNRLQADRRHLGMAYGLNTLTFCIGLVGFTYLAPRVSIFYSLKLMMVFLVIGLLLLALIRESRRLSVWVPSAAVVVFAVAAVFTPSEYDPGFAQPRSPAARYPVRAMKSNLMHTTYIVSEPTGEYLYFDGHSMSGTNFPSQHYMRLMAHFPLLAQPDPRRVLLVGFGVGNTASAIAAHETVKEIDVVDLNRTVLHTASEFERSNDRVYLDPRMRYINDDGRNFLNLTDRRYDLITSEPPPPLMVGVYRLYSKEYYEKVLEHLTPRGMMTQWLPIYQLPPRACELIVATFVQMFPHSLLFVGAGEELILVGSRSPIDLQQIENRYSLQQYVLWDLERLQVPGPVGLLARILMVEKDLRMEYGDLPVISDERNDLAYMFENLSNPASITYQPRLLLDHFASHRLASQDSLRQFFTDSQTRRRYVPDFPRHILRNAPNAR